MFHHARWETQHVRKIALCWGGFFRGTKRSTTRMAVPTSLSQIAFPDLTHLPLPFAGSFTFPLNHMKKLQGSSWSIPSLCLSFVHTCWFVFPLFFFPVDNNTHKYSMGAPVAFFWELQRLFFWYPHRRPFLKNSGSWIPRPGSCFRARRLGPKMWLGEFSQKSPVRGPWWGWWVGGPVGLRVG